jgi:ABC-type uncharacterized transport system permease subunit
MTRQKLLFGSVVILTVTLVAALLVALVLLSIGASPLETYKTILTGPLSDLFGVTEVLVRSVPLMLVGLGIAISFRSGILNIGAEGQIQMGVLAATAMALAFPGLSKPVLLPMVLLAGALGGAIWGGIAGWLRARLQVNEILSTVMLNYIAAQIHTFLLRGPMLDPNELETGSGTPQSMRLPEASFLDQIVPNTRLHSGLILALVAAVLVWILLWKTTLGYRMRAAGAGAKAARYAGIPVERYLIVAMLLAGGFAGLAGAVEVTGVHHRAIEGISSGYGFAGIVVALFGMLHPGGIIPSSVFFGILLIGADMTQRTASVPANMVLVLQGVIILSIVSAQSFLRNPYAQARVSRWLGRFLPGSSGPEKGAPS